MAGERTFTVKFISDTAQALGGFGRLEKGLGSLNKSVTDGIGKGLDNLIPSFRTIQIAGAAAFAGVAALAFKSAQAAAEDQQAQALLANQLIQTIGATTSQISEIEKFIDVTQRATGVTDTELRPALMSLVRATGDAQKAQELLDLALNVSAGTGKGLGEVSIALAKGFNGQVTALTRLGIPIDETAKKTKDFGKIQEDLNTTFAGASAAAAGTFQGSMSRLKVVLGEATEKLGYAIINNELFKQTFEKLPGAIDKAIAAFGSGGFKGALDAFLSNLGLFGTQVKYFLDAVAVAFYDTAKRVTDAVRIMDIPIGFLRGVLKALQGDFSDTKGIIPDLTNELINAQLQFGATANLLKDQTLQFQVDANAKRSATAAGQRYTDQARALGKTVKESADSLSDQSKKTGGASKTLETAAEKLKKYTSALTTATSAQKAMEASARGVAKAQKGLDDATASVADAQAAFNAAMKGGDAVKIAAAQKVLDQAQRGLARAGFSVEQSVFAVADAEKKLAEVRKDPESTPQMIREAEIALAEAKLSVSDATDSQAEAATGLKDAQLALNESTNGAIKGSKLFLEVSKALKDAEDARAEAAQRVTDAIDAQTEAIMRFNDALKASNELAALYPKVSAGVANPFAGMAPISIPQPGAVGGSTMNGSPINITVNAGLGTSGAAVGKEIADYLTDYVAVGGQVSSRFLRFGQ